MVESLQPSFIAYLALLSSAFRCKPGHRNEVAIMNAGAAMLLTKEAAVDELYRAIRDTRKPKECMNSSTDGSRPMCCFIRNSVFAMPIRLSVSPVEPMCLV